MRKLKLKNWLKKVKNYYETLRYLRENKMVGIPTIDDNFFSNLIDFLNVICFAPKRFYVLYIEHYCKGRTFKEISEELDYSCTQIYNIHKAFLEWLVLNFKI